MEPERKRDEDLPGRDRAAAERAAERETRRLLRDLVCKAVPAVPRKLNRVGELFGLCLEVAGKNNWWMTERKEQLTLLRLVILQLLAPNLYRFGRHYAVFFSQMEAWCSEHGKAGQSHTTRQRYSRPHRDPRSSGESSARGLRGRS